MIHDDYGEFDEYRRIPTNTYEYDEYDEDNGGLMIFLSCSSEKASHPFRRWKHIGSAKSQKHEGPGGSGSRAMHTIADILTWSRCMIR